MNRTLNFVAIEQELLRHRSYFPFFGESGGGGGGFGGGGGGGAGNGSLGGW